MSIDNNCYPFDLKLAEVIPVFKKKDDVIKKMIDLSVFYLVCQRSSKKLPSKYSSWWRRLEDVLKMSFVFAFKRRLQDVLIKTNIFGIVIRLQKMYWSRPIFSSWSYVFKASSRRLQDVFKTSSRSLAKTSLRRLQDVFFFAEILNGFKPLTIFGKKAPSQIFDWVENRSLAKGLKYWVYSSSKSLNEVEKILSRKICVTSFLKKQKQTARVFMQKQPSEGFFKKRVMRNFAEFTRKHLCQKPFW